MPAEHDGTTSSRREDKITLYPLSGPISKEHRRCRNKHHSCVVWLTGLSGSGKSTLAHRLEECLFREGHQVCVLDGDNLRNGLNKDLGFSRQDRRENIRRIAATAKLFVDAGLVVIVAVISPYRTDRVLARNLFPEGDFLEVYVKCPLTVCEQRDVKGLYKRARSHEIPHFTGISAPYEEPLAPDLLIETDQLDIEECIDQLRSFLREKLNRVLV